MPRVGRPEDPVWRGYNVHMEKGFKCGRCKACDNVVSNNTYRLRRHVALCEGQKELRAILAKPKLQPIQLPVFLKGSNNAVAQQGL